MSNDRGMVKTDPCAHDDCARPVGDGPTGLCNECEAEAYAPVAPAEIILADGDDPDFDPPSYRLTRVKKGIRLMVTTMSGELIREFVVGIDIDPDSMEITDADIEVFSDGSMDLEEVENLLRDEAERESNASAASNPIPVPTV